MLGGSSEHFWGKPNKAERTKLPENKNARLRLKRSLAEVLMWCCYFGRFVFDAFEVAIATSDDFSFVFFENSARTVLAICAESILYRIAVRARFESFASGCLGL